VASDGTLALTYEGLDRPQVVDRAQLIAKVKGFIATDPQLPVYVAGDRDASYQTVYEVLTALQREAKVSRAGLMGNPAESRGK
jgi:biopolymer transport protein TolR